MEYSGSYFKKQTPGWFNTGRQGPGGSEHPGLRLPAPPLPAGAAARRPVPCVPNPALLTIVSVKGQKILRGGGCAVHGVAFSSDVLASTRHVPVAPPPPSRQPETSPYIAQCRLGAKSHQTESVSPWVLCKASIPLPEKKGLQHSNQGFRRRVPGAPGRAPSWSGSRSCVFPAGLLALDLLLPRARGSAVKAG